MLAGPAGPLGILKATCEWILPQPLEESWMSSDSPAGVQVQTPSPRSVIRLGYNDFADRVQRGHENVLIHKERGERDQQSVTHKGKEENGGTQRQRLQATPKSTGNTRISEKVLEHVFPRVFRGNTCQLQIPSLQEQGTSLLVKVARFAGKALSLNSFLKNRPCKEIFGIEKQFSRLLRAGLTVMHSSCCNDLWSCKGDSPC